MRTMMEEAPKKRAHSLQTAPAKPSFFQKVTKAKPPPKRYEDSRSDSGSLDTHYQSFQTPVMTKTADGFSDLCTAINRGDAAEVRALLQSTRQEANLANAEGDLPLHLACMHNEAHMVTLLIEAGAHINSMDKYGDTPLHLACRHADIHIVQELLDQFASTAIVNRRGWTALEEAEERARHDNAGSPIYHVVLEASIPKAASGPGTDVAEPVRSRSRTYSVSLHKDPSFVESVISWFRKL
ncbi:hypothetical protein ACHHYP_16980 [Achlya hypogyna]|uniref:Uncharacterized protein n=1 Tax=Achlya hypogyna TaxID=1202772 RepID=A0A1V9Y5G0_ACHHY|nr:hypothetical protein ACHHYP_16980 [Achlya hypogyna]